MLWRHTYAFACQLPRTGRWPRRRDRLHMGRGPIPFRQPGSLLGRRVNPVPGRAAILLAACWRVERPGMMLGWGPRPGTYCDGWQEMFKGSLRDDQDDDACSNALKPLCPRAPGAPTVANGETALLAEPTERQRAAWHGQTHSLVIARDNIALIFMNNSA